MAAVEEDVDDRFQDIDIESLLSRVQRRPLTFSRSKSVYKAPEFTQRLKGEETVDEGSDLTLSFKVTGVPQPTLRWFKDDEEVLDHPRLTVEERGDGGYRLTVHQVNKGDEAAYRCRAENTEGSCSCCFFLSVKGKPKSSKREGKGSPHKRTVSFPPMFSTIVEKVEEEEKCGRETADAPESPLTHFYNNLTLKSRQSWPSFLGDWAFVNGRHKTRGGVYRMCSVNPGVCRICSVQPAVVECVVFSQVCIECVVFSQVCIACVVFSQVCIERVVFSLLYAERVMFSKVCIEYVVFSQVCIECVVFSHVCIECVVFSQVCIEYVVFNQVCIECEVFSQLYTE
ncbi:hypothetical protein BaRGS_00034866 [Batillaria attramentaria]|uniref:Ig-like domain-containing protein n=1 Tax=Batillaria attramentaria TaxID=370345 RepID=A0ABD0JG69_9CAEN